MCVGDNLDPHRDVLYRTMGGDENNDELDREGDRRTRSIRVTSVTENSQKS